MKGTMRMIYDVGMYDGEDTAYYLDSGYSVLAVEANPILVERGQSRFRAAIDRGTLTIVHAAIVAEGAGDRVDLTLCGDDPGSSSLFLSRISDRQPNGICSVPAITLPELFRDYGIPEYMKVDIEGADRFCVLALTRETRPRYVSFEAGDDVEELLAHLSALGYGRFKIISVLSFRELENQRSLADRARGRLMRYMGFSDPQRIRRRGRFFVTGSSSGPVPWETDGKWRSAIETRNRLQSARASHALSGWYDIHAHCEGL